MNQNLHWNYTSTMHDQMYYPQKKYKKFLIWHLHFNMEKWQVKKTKILLNLWNCRKKCIHIKPEDLRSHPEGKQVYNGHVRHWYQFHFSGTIKEQIRKRTIESYKKIAGVSQGKKISSQGTHAVQQVSTRYQETFERTKKISNWRRPMYTEQIQWRPP